jgi:hypothetical protein
VIAWGWRFGAATAAGFRPEWGTTYQLRAERSAALGSYSRINASPERAKHSGVARRPCLQSVTPLQGWDHPFLMTQGGAAAASAASALPWAVMWLPLRGVVDASLSWTLSRACTPSTRTTEEELDLDGSSS